jgi:hypothetical protein
VAQKPASRIYDQHYEGFFARIKPGSGGNVLSPIIDGQFRSVDMGYAGRALPDSHHFEFAGWFFGLFLRFEVVHLMVEMNHLLIVGGCCYFR